MTTGEVIQPLSPDEKTKYLAAESTIRTGRRIFIAVGKALREIRDLKLYREDFPDFDTYCRERWHFKRKRANQVIAASEAAVELGDLNVSIPNPAVISEVARQARTLAKDDPTHQKEIARQIVTQAAAIANIEGKPLNARHVQEAIQPVKQSDDDKTRRAVVESGFSAIIQRMNKGELSPDAALALVDAIKACEPKVRGDMLLLGTSDPAFIRLMNRKRHTETYTEIVRTGWLQAAKWQKQADKATAADLQRLLDERHQEHKFEAATLADAAKGIVEKTLTLKIGDLDYSASMLEQVYGYKNAVELAEYVIQRAKRRELETGTAYVQ